MLKSNKIAGIGEILWDVLPGGKQLGGAPSNFAYHALQAGFDSLVVSAVGTDNDGEEILDVLDKLELSRSFIQTTQDYPTGTVTVQLGDNGIPDYTIHENVAWDHIQWNRELEALSGDVDAVCFGSLAQRHPDSKGSILKFLECTRAECLRVFDINLRQSFYTREDILKSLEFASVLKLNEDELPVLARYLGYEGDDERQLQRLVEDFSLKLVALTQGSEGSILWSAEERSHCMVPEVEIADTVGAGDSFTAILLAGLLRNRDLKEIHKVATEVAAFVCTQNGATPVFPNSLIEKVRI